MNQLEREEQALEDSFARGEITLQEFNEQMRELMRDYREQALDSAREAYDSELERW